MRVEPKSVLRFVLQYFDLLCQLLETQKQESMIRSESLALLCEHHGADVKNQLLEFKILKPLNGDYEMRQVYEEFFSFILTDFKLDLPESIEKYYSSVSSLFANIRGTDANEKQILAKRLEGLYDQVKEFIERVEGNTLRLLAETRALKANVEKIDYTEKVQKASFWVDYYIVPLNKILDVNHSQSVANKLHEVAQYCNEKRLIFPEESIRLQFEKLYTFLINVNDELLLQSKILTNELMPLIERIKTESLILTGFIELLKNPDKQKTPKMLASKRNYPYSANICLNAIEYFEQFLQHEDVYLQDEELQQERWVFNKDNYRGKLQESLPVPDFFSWCANTLSTEFGENDIEKYFALTSLLFEEDLNLEFEERGEEECTIELKETTLQVPKIKITQQHELSDLS